MIFPWHHRWNVLAFTMLAQTCVAGLAYCFPFWVVPWADEFRVPHSELMLIISLDALLSGLASPIAGWLFERYRIRVLFVLGVIGIGALFTWMSLTHSYAVILTGHGLLLPLANILTTTMFAQIAVTRWFFDHRGLALGISAMGISLGAFVMPLIATWLLAHYSWHEAFRIIAAAECLILIPPALLVLARDPDHTAVTTAQSHDRPATAMSNTEILSNRAFWLIAFGFGSMTFASLPVQFALGSHARDLGIGQQQAAIAASLSAISFACGKLGFGKLADWLPARRSYWLAALLILVGIGIHSATDSLIGLTIGLMLITTGLGCTLPLSASMVIVFFGQHSFSRALGLLWFFLGLAMTSPFLAGLIRDHAGNYQTAYLLLSLPLLLAALAMRWLPAPPISKTL